MSKNKLFQESIFSFMGVHLSTGQRDIQPVVEITNELKPGITRHLRPTSPNLSYSLENVRPIISKLTL